jgi:predicted secreted protein
MMAKAPGRLAVLSRGATVIAGIKSLKIEFTAEPIEVTDQTSLGVVEYLGASKTTQCKISCSGITDTTTLRTLWHSPTTQKLLTDITFKFADGALATDTVGGNFFMTSYSEENPDDEACTFAAEFVSSGAWSVT